MGWRVTWKSVLVDPFVRVNQWVGSNLKAVLGRTMVYRPFGYRVFGLPRSDTDFYGTVGDGTGSSTVTAPLFWVARTFPDAPPSLWRILETGEEEQVLRHPLLRLLRRPNAFTTGRVLWMATVIDYMVDGNAYWIKLRNGAGSVSELWWTPSWLMEPKGDESTLITHYEYKPGIDPLRVKPDDVVHFRFGIDSDDVKKGKSPLKSVLREVFTDDEAASYTISILKNIGVPGLIVSPTQGSIERELAEETKATLMSKFTGDRRGEPMVMLGPTEVEQFGFSPEQLLLRELRRVPEERVTAVMGVPAIVAGLGAGLDRSTFTNYVEARQAAYEQGIIPLQGNMSAEVEFQLLTEWLDVDEIADEWRFRFDLSGARLFQDDVTKVGARLNAAVNAGVAMRSEARRAHGLQVDRARDDVFLVPKNMSVVPAEMAAMPVMDPGANGNGTAAMAALASN